MIIRRAFKPILTGTNPAAIAITSTTYTNNPRRFAHTRKHRVRPTPLPTPFVPDPSTFLSLIGRSLSQHASKFESWAALFNLNSEQLKDLGIEPTRARRYLQRWREKFRRGEWGVGGDLKYVEDGVGIVGIVEVPCAVRRRDSAEGESAGAAEAATMTPEVAIGSGLATLTRSAGRRRRIVSLPSGTTALPEGVDMESAERVALLKIKGLSQISGPYVELLPGTEGQLAKIKVREGLWEHKRGHKVDGGERRKAEVRAKKRAAEKRE